MKQVPFKAGPCKAKEIVGGLSNCTSLQICRLKSDLHSQTSKGKHTSHVFAFKRVPYVRTRRPPVYIIHIYMSVFLYILYIYMFINNLQAYFYNIV